jgi:hypothetical protein
MIKTLVSRESLDSKVAADAHQRRTFQLVSPESECPIHGIRA